MQRCTHMYVGSYMSMSMSMYMYMHDCTWTWTCSWQAACGMHNTHNKLNEPYLQTMITE